MKDALVHRKTIFTRKRRELTTSYEDLSLLTWHPISKIIMTIKQCIVNACLLRKSNVVLPILDVTLVDWHEIDGRVNMILITISTCLIDLILFRIIINIISINSRTNRMEEYRSV